MPASTIQRHFKTQATELERRYDTLTKRITALDTDIGRELDSERKLVLQERRGDLDRERSEIAADIDRIERQLAGSRADPIADRAPAQAFTDPAGIPMPTQRISLERQLAELRENLRLIEERKSEYVLATDVPLLLVKEHNRTLQQIKDLEDQLSQIK